MKKHVFALAALCALTTSAFAQSAPAGESPWLVRARAVHLDSANSNSPNVGLSINNKWIPEADISYFFTPNIAAELILTYPQKQTVYLKGGKIGSLKHLPPTLTAQYHFTNFGPNFKPYVGAGLNYTRFSGVKLPSGISVDKNSFGPALQVGVDVPVTKNVYLNLDVKKVWIDTDVSAGGKKLTNFKVDPVLVGVGVGYRF